MLVLVNGALAVAGLALGSILLFKVKMVLGGVSAPEGFGQEMLVGAGGLLFLITGGILTIMSAGAAWLYRRSAAGTRLGVPAKSFLVISTFPAAVLVAILSSRMMVHALAK